MTKECRVDGCSEPTLANSLCRRHYDQDRNGRPFTSPRRWLDAEPLRQLKTWSESPLDEPNTAKPAHLSDALYQQLIIALREGRVTEDQADRICCACGRNLEEMWPDWLPSE